MSEDDPVSVWLEDLKNGKDSAAPKIWHHFILRLYEVARNKIHAKSQRVYDERDAAQSAFNSLFAGIAAGRFPDLNDRTGLWRLLLVITSRKISNRHRYDHRQQRDVRKTNTDSVFLTIDSAAMIDNMPAREPTPEFAAEFLELYRSLFNKLDEQLQRISWLKMEGFSNQEIADELDCPVRTIRRKLERIRRIWQDSKESEDL